MGDHPEGYNVYTRVQTNIDSLLRELSGPRPLRRVVDIVSKPRIWSRGTKTISLESRPTLQVTGMGRTVISSTSAILTLAYTSTHDCSVTPVYARWKFSETEERPRLVEPFYDGCYTSLALWTVTQ